MSLKSRAMFDHVSPLIWTPSARYGDLRLRWFTDHTGTLYEIKRVYGRIILHLFVPNFPTPLKEAVHNGSNWSKARAASVGGSNTKM